MSLTDTEKQFIREKMNPEGHNQKDCNWFKVLSRNGTIVSVEIGYWISYINCKPRYQKEVRSFDFSQD